MGIPGALTLILGLLPFVAGGFAVGRKRVRVIGLLIILAPGLGLVRRCLEWLNL